jgi:hypothetical protein
MSKVENDSAIALRKIQRRFLRDHGREPTRGELLRELNASERFDWDTPEDVAEEVYRPLQSSSAAAFRAQLKSAMAPAAQKKERQKLSLAAARSISEARVQSRTQMAMDRLSAIPGPAAAAAAVPMTVPMTPGDYRTYKDAGSGIEYLVQEQPDGSTVYVKGLNGVDDVEVPTSFFRKAYHETMARADTTSRHPELWNPVRPEKEIEFQKLYKTALDNLAVVTGDPAVHKKLTNETIALRYMYLYHIPGKYLDYFYIMDEIPVISQGSMGLRVPGGRKRLGRLRSRRSKSTSKKSKSKSRSKKFKSKSTKRKKSRKSRG